MHDSIFQLGKTLSMGIDKFCDPVKMVENVIGIVFRRQRRSVAYLRTERSVFTRKRDYLFARDLSGQGPGLFLTGRVYYTDIRKLQNAIRDNGGVIDLQNETVANFVRKKISWLHTTSKFLQKDEILDTLPEERQQEIRWFRATFARLHDRIATDVVRHLIADDPKTTLITVMFHENGESRFVGQIRDYVDFFERCCFAKKSRHQGQSELLTCCTCNKRKRIDTFERPPLPFLYLNKPMFAPNTDERQSKKIFPICNACFPILKSGWSWINEFLDFSIPKADQGAESLRFVLIPRLRDYDLMKQFRRNATSKRLYLDKIKILCRELKTISAWDNGLAAVNSFLNFSTLYYTYDNNGSMRPFSLVNGIYPDRLVEVLDVKTEVDNIFPFVYLSTVFQTKFIVGFPVLAQIYAGTIIKWQDKLAETISKIFTGKKIVIDEVIKIINLSVLELAYREPLRKKVKSGVDIEQLSVVSLRGLQLLEYLNRLNHEVNQPMPMNNPISLNEQTAFYDEFLKGKSLLSDSTARGSFAVGVSVGILLCAQEIHHKGNTPFASQLYVRKKLENILKFFPEAQRLLTYYSKNEKIGHKYDRMLDRLGVDISNVDLTSEISNDVVELAFSLGISVGNLIGKDNFPR